MDRVDSVEIILFLALKLIKGEENGADAVREGLLNFGKDSQFQKLLVPKSFQFQRYLSLTLCTKYKHAEKIFPQRT